MKKKISSNVLKVIPIRKYDYTNDCYVNEDRTTLDLVCVKCKDFASQSNSDIERDMLILTEFFRLYKDDIKIIAINIPTNCEEQISFLNFKISTCQNEYRRKQLEIKKEEQEWIQKNRLNKEFYIMFFARDMEEHKKLKNLIEDNLGSSNLLLPITKKQKDIVLMKMNNKNIKS